QAFVPSGEDEYELVPREDRKATEEVNKYIEDLAKSNPKISFIMRKLWDNVLDNPEDYRDKNVSNILEDMVQSEEHAIIHDFSNRWELKEEELTYVVANYNPRRDKQNGENELKQSADYHSYREKVDQPVP